ncbi:hypothetical protein A6769_14965 [Nostoc punctiforme NIES-2108]|uniref:Uncharacterized protein n=1 Tax=Nostoc punctiforme NIES-2108 TaxID=1356359 RepID=A0A367RM53_NOSPU|nr:hypothetical protein A6769_14965 [Nostoc punctiforme NIES-2108]
MKKQLLQSIKHLQQLLIHFLEILKPFLYIIKQLLQSIKHLQQLLIHFLEILKPFLYIIKQLLQTLEFWQLALKINGVTSAELQVRLFTQHY